MSRTAVNTDRWGTPATVPTGHGFAMNWMRIIDLAEEYAPELYLQLMGFPPDLPNLRQLRPPGGNSRPDGIEDSYYEMRHRDELPDEY